MLKLIIFLALTAANVDFSWTANPPAENVTGYKLMIGPGDGTYPQVVDVGNVTTKRLPDDTLMRSAVVVAYNAAGFESAPSPVLVYRPQQAGRPTAQRIP